MDAHTAKLITIKILHQRGRKVNLRTGPITVAQMILGESAIFISSPGYARKIIKTFLDKYLADGRELPPGVEDLRTNAKNAVKSDVEVGVGKKFYSSAAWASVRYAALKQHGGACQCCGAKASDGTTIHVDHIKPRSTHPHLALDIHNLQVLCWQCNYGKLNRDETDWRPPEKQQRVSRSRFLGQRARDENQNNVIDFAISLKEAS